MKKFSLVFLLHFAGLLALAQFSQAAFPNVKLDEGGRCCEPSIKIDPNNPARIVAASVLDNYYFSVDTGRTWTTGRIKSPHGVWGDPVIDVDGKGSFYFLHLSNDPEGSWIDRIVCQRSDDGGNTWNDGSYAGLNGSKAQDKHWTVIDHKTNVIHMTWTQFDKYNSPDTLDRSRIMYSQSNDRGESWAEAKVISTTTGNCLDNDDTVEGAVPSLGPNGEIYVSWAGPEGLVFKSSLDNGLTWTDDEILIDPMPNGWTFDVPGIFRCNGLPITKCDRSGGERHGTLYVNWTDQRKGAGDTEVWLKRSVDEGKTWSNLIKVNNSQAGSHQFFTWMDIDQSTGYLYFMYYDRRSGLNQTHVAMSISKDGGETFHHFRLSETPFLADKEVFFGDYNNISAEQGVVRPIWTRMNKKQTSVWTALVEPGIAEKCFSRKESITMSFDVPKRKKVKLYWGNTLVRDLRKPKMKKKYDSGKQSYTHELKGESQGEFLYKIKAGKKVLSSGKIYLN